RGKGSGGRAAYNCHTLALEFLAIVIAEDAGDFGKLDDAIAFISDVSEDFDDALVHHALGGLHMDIAEVEITQILFRFGGENGRRRRRRFWSEGEPAERAQDQNHGERDDNAGG